MLHREEIPAQYPVYMEVMDTSVKEQAFIVNRTL